MPGTAYLKFATLDRYDHEAREYTAHYLIDGVDPTEGGTTILLASGMPSLGTSYSAGSESDTYAVAVGYSGVQPVNWDASREVWQASVKYSTDPNKQRRQSQNEDNPINKAPIISGSGHRRRMPAHSVRENDQVGGFVQNTAGGHFRDEDVEVDVSSPLLRITKNYATLDLDTLMDYTDSVNSALWMNGAARTWKMDPPQWRKVYWGTTAYYEISYSFQANDATWDLQPRNEGKLDKNGKPPSIIGVVTSDWYPLDLNGDWEFFNPIINAIGNIRFDGQGGNPDPIRWYKERDFTSLGLPSTV